MRFATISMDFNGIFVGFVSIFICIFIAFREIFISFISILSYFQRFVKLSLFWWVLHEFIAFCPNLEDFHRNCTIFFPASVKFPPILDGYVLDLSDFHHLPPPEVRGALRYVQISLAINRFLYSISILLYSLDGFLY